MASSRLVRSYTLPAVTPFAASVMFFEALNFLAVMPLPVVEHRPESRARCPQRKDEVGDSFVVAVQQVRAWVRTRPEATLRPGQASGRRIVSAGRCVALRHAQSISAAKSASRNRTDQSLTSRNTRNFIRPLSFARSA